MSDISERRINSLIAEGKLEEAFSLIVDKYSETLYWKIRQIVLTHDDANDILQNTFLKAWQALDTFEGKSKLSTWLHRIAINEALDFIRRNKKRMAAADSGGVASMLLADEYFDGDKAQAMLQEAIATLPDVQRTVFTLRYYNNLKYSEMSRILDTTVGALKASYHLAVKKIAQYVLNHYGE